MEWLVALAMVGGAIVGCGLLMVITQLIERSKASRSNEIYYIYQEHLEKASDVHRRRGH